MVSEIYRQQLWLYENNKKSIDYRIVSLNQPHIRPIIRGKAGKTVEFGAKLSASCFDGYVFLDRISWNNFNESTDLKIQIESFKKYTGYYPESVHVDKIYRTQKTELGAKNEVLESVDHLWEDHLLILVKRKRNKLHQMRRFVVALKVNLDKVKEDLISIV